MIRRLFVSTLLAVGSHAGAAPAVVPDTIAQRVQACTVCHGKDGIAAPDGFRPRIAGKPAGYLFHQLLNFRDGRRHYGPMVRLVDPLTDAYLREIAEHFAALDLPYAPPLAATEPATVLQRGRQLVEQGDVTAKLPACQACHGAALTGMLPATPGLVGLPRDYLAAQLGAWIHGQRRAIAPDCMADVAKHLCPSDVTAVSAWLASRPVPLPAKPAPRPTAELPLRCGSVVESAP